jgi:transcription factor IIIB subunit 2
MKRDWICTGRRPSGLCGAAILIAARYHGFKRDISEIVMTVNTCDETIRKRLKEFKNTNAALLTRGEFEALDIKTDDKERIQAGENEGMDPPSFIKSIISKRKLEIMNNAEITKEIYETA